MTRLDDETLVAYVDGELPPDRRAAVEQIVRADAGLTRLIEGLRADQELIRRAFEVAPAHPTDRPADAGVVLALPRRPLRQRLRLAALPMAAALVGLMVGAGATGLALRDTGNGAVATFAFASDSQRLETLQHSLETAPSGTEVSWRDEATGGQGTLTVVRTFQAADGSYCRQFTEDMTARDTRLHLIGVACREGQTWHTKVQVIES